MHNVPVEYDKNLTVNNLDVQKDSGVYACKIDTNVTTAAEGLENDEIRIKVLGTTAFLDSFLLMPFLNRNHFFRQKYWSPLFV